MLRFFPIDSGNTSHVTNLVDLSYKAGAIIADFACWDDDPHWLRVQFPRVEIIRVLDEMPLSTEQNWEAATGDVAGHFAYRVEGAHFWLSQSEAFRSAYSNCSHYLFVTMDTCLDVISAEAPTFSLTPARWSELGLDA